MKKEITYVRAVKLPVEGVFEFKAWNRAQFLGIEQREYNGKLTNPHLVYTDCPAATQTIYRMRVISGQSQIPTDESWHPLAEVFKTKLSFGTLWITAANRKKKQNETENTEAVAVEPDVIVGANAN